MRRINLYITILATLTGLFTMLPLPVSAVDVFERDVCSRDNNGSGNSAVCKDKDATGNPLFGANGIITTIINLLSTIVGIVAVITIILAGLKYVTSGNNPQDVSNARERIIYAAVALVIAASAQLIVRFILGRIGT